MYSYNNLWECGLGWVTNYWTLIKLSIWHSLWLNTINTWPSALRSKDRHDNVVITTTSVMKCIFLNFGAIPKRMVKVAKLKLQCRVHIKFIYVQKINKTIYKKENKTIYNLKFPPSSSSSFFPTPHSPLLLPLGIWYFLQNILKHTFSKEIIGTP